MMDEETPTIGERIDANERARQRGINHARTLIECWDEMTEAERLEGVKTVLDRLSRPF